MELSDPPRISECSCGRLGRHISTHGRRWCCGCVLLLIQYAVLFHTLPRAYARDTSTKPANAEALHHQKADIKIGIVLSVYSSYQEWADADSLTAALMEQPTLRAYANTTWSFEFFCAEIAATAALAAGSRASRCFSAHVVRQAVPSAAAGELFGTWAKGLDRIIALTSPPPSSMCEELALKRLNGARPETAAEDERDDGHNARRSAVAVQKTRGPVCFYLPPVSELQGASAWSLWQTHVMTQTEVYLCSSFSSLTSPWHYKALSLLSRSSRACLSSCQMLAGMGTRAV